MQFNLHVRRTQDTYIYTFTISKNAQLFRRARKSIRREIFSRRAALADRLGRARLFTRRVVYLPETLPGYSSKSINFIFSAERAVEGFRRKLESGLLSALDLFRAHYITPTDGRYSSESLISPRDKDSRFRLSARPQQRSQRPPQMPSIQIASRVFLGTPIS